MVAELSFGSGDPQVGTARGASVPDTGLTRLLWKMTIGWPFAWMKPVSDSVRCRSVRLGVDRLVTV